MQRSRTNLQVFASSAKEKVLQLISGGLSKPQSSELEGAVKELISRCPIGKDSLAAQSFLLGQGTWEVFHAPHISRMASVMGVAFDPILYTLQGDKIASNVKYSHPLLGSGWLSAAGAIGKRPFVHRICLAR